MSSSNSSVESLLKDAEKLVSRLKTHEKAADLLLGQSDGLHKTIKAKSAYMQVRLRPRQMFGNQVAVASVFAPMTN